VQAVSELYKQIITETNHWFEVRVDVGGAEIGEDALMSVSVSNALFDGVPSVGNATAGEVVVRLLDTGMQIPRMARIQPYVRVTNGTDASEWIQQGVFFLDTREVTHNDGGLDVLTLTGYDVMLKADQPYPYDTQEIASTVVKNIVALMGLTLADIDDHVWEVIPVNGGDTIQCSGEYTAREHLQYIAALYGGNWTITNEGKLNLVRINDIPPETSLLTDEYGFTINFGAAEYDDTEDAQRIVV
jgi:hypothetical protein